MARSTGCSATATPITGSSMPSWIKEELKMTIAELLLPEVDQEMATTRRVLERVPDDKLAWTPHEKSFSMGQLASHVANLIKWTDATMNRTEMDMATVPPGQMNVEATSRAQ